MQVKSLTLWLVAAVCIGPMALAWLLYFGPFDIAGLPSLAGSRELGQAGLTLPEALRPEPRAADAPAPWALIYVQTADCDSDCRTAVERLAAVRLALGDDLRRVQRMLVYRGERPDFADDATLAIARIDAGRDAEWLATVASDERLRTGRVLIVDPLGNLVVSYPPDVPQKELLRDLKRLLSISQIG
jgi:hypothetical protein